MPIWLKDAVKQSKDNSIEGKIPILILKEKYRSDDTALVITELGDFEEFSRTHKPKTPIEP